MKVVHQLAATTKTGLLRRFPTQWSCFSAPPGRPLSLERLTTHDNHILVSQSTSIFENLSFEYWLFDKVPMTKAKNVLFLYQNKPCVVFGTHQTPWQECNIVELRHRGIDLCRRHSGGGCVFHDLGNLNLSFITERGRYCRKRNLSFVVSALKSRFPALPISANPRDDLVLDGSFKVSGSASRLGGKTSYHHLTLLVDADLRGLSSLLKPTLPNITTRATASVPSPVKNLRDVEPSIDVAAVIELMAEHFWRTYNQQGSWGADPHLFQYVDPTDERLFPGVARERERISSWDWTFGHCPRFTLEHSPPAGGAVRLEVGNGLIECIEVSQPGWTPSLRHQFIGRRFDVAALSELDVLLAKIY